ncbi:tellurite resistance TerB family protein [Halomonas sp. TRM85114]|uniref:tellurite resistance TerB family protein n=1 Tax=Halomonas jincaotanensis TaxID=2810616 RepID=UPI001BD4A22A|nr:tellurite resistance TerB family protein [Halomonas jincaotanensis]MBS9405547.1 tellurite resistance TerB family protein [Halomonas jincaotanensis]
MNASKIFQQLMQQAGGKSGGKSGSGGVDVQGMLEGLSKQFGGGQSSPGKAEGSSGSSGSSGFDMKSLLGGGALGMLVGSSRGRKLGGKALKYGAVAGVGALAWKAWQNYQADSQAPSQNTTPQANPTADSGQGEPVERLDGEASEQRSLELLQALIMAARSDGHVDERERALLTDQIDAMGADPELHAWVEEQFKAPLNAEALARQADSPQAAREMYLVSVAVIDEQNPMERAWLDQLAKALKLDPTLTEELERQARDAS